MKAEIKKPAKHAISVARQRAKKLANQRNLAAFANDTKWREFFVEISNRAIAVELKFIYSEEVMKCNRVWIPVKNYIDGGNAGPELFVFVEWVRANAVEEISNVAKKVGLEFSTKDGQVIVYGYK